MEIGILTAASEKYADSLICLIGSLRCNWIGHPPIIVYDLGLEEQTLSFLKKHHVVVKQIDKFCEHYRKHYTWKIWCLINSEFKITLWMDAGVFILKPLDNIIEIIRTRSYFLVPNYQFLDYEASPQACEACGLDYSFRIGKGAIAATFIGYSRDSIFSGIIEEVHRISLLEENIKAHDVRNKHDQALISLLVYKYIPNPILEDGIKYLGWKSPNMIKDQVVWLQRRNILKYDIKLIKKQFEKDVFYENYIPKDPRKMFFVFKLFKKTVITMKSVGRWVLNKNHIDGIR